MAKRHSNLQTIRTEGGLLPADQLSRIATGDAEGISPQDYDLAPGEKVNEAISQSWARLTRFWADFQEARKAIPTDQAGTEVTNQKWLLPLFRELGYGKLVASKAPEIDGKTYAITRFVGNLPIHLVGCNILLDKRSPGIKGAATGAPHGLVQEFLNRCENYIWAFVSNGLQLRVLRDNVSLSRQAYVEFDLEAMFEGEVYSDFALLWMVCHVTRTAGERPEQCWLEKWSSAAREQGTRVLEDLRNGVERAIEALGRGFVSHPANDLLRQRLRDGLLEKQALYHQILRTVYRLLFLFVAEDRDLLHPPDASDTARDLYDQHYSTRRLRDLAGQIKGSRHGDLWHVLSLVFRAVSGTPSADAIRKMLGLPVFGSRLWDLSETADIAGPGQGIEQAVYISNDDLLDAIRHLAYVQQSHTLRTVNYRDLGSEELGSVYESLLELQPDIHPEARQFELRTVAGSERKTTGSYYTHTSLVQSLLDSALEPVIADRLKAAATIEDKQQALLDLKVCDPASGSGHFLIAAAHRIARHLSRLRAMAAGEAEPSPDVYQHALRDVIAHCIYGVDINPMAVELCKISLWLEAIDPGKPLAFLDHHIQCGNSLFGATPALIKHGIPDDAFKPVEGDDSSVCSELKRRNREERCGQGALHFSALPWLKLGNLVQSFAHLSAEDDSTPDALAAKEQHYVELVRSTPYENARLIADAWCAAFVCTKGPNSPVEITQAIFRRWEENPHCVTPAEKAELFRLRDQYKFFTWHLAFPEVFQPQAEDQIPKGEIAGWSGGFDCILGNPPWDVLEDEEKKFFASIRPDIAEASTSIRKRLIEALEQGDPFLFHLWERFRDERSRFKHYHRACNRFPLSSYKKLNLYASFLESALLTLGAKGYLGLIVQSGLATDESRMFLFKHVFKSGRLKSLHDFENSELLFRDVHPQQKFSLVTLAPAEPDRQATFSFYNTRVAHLRESDRSFTLTADDMERISPNTGACPTFRCKRDGDVVRRMYSAAPVFGSDAAGPLWQLTFRQMFNSSTDEPEFRKTTEDELARDPADIHAAMQQDGWLPVYEGKYIGQFTHRLGTFAQVPQGQLSRGSERPVSPEELASPEAYVIPRWWSEADKVSSRVYSEQAGRSWFLGFCDIANPQNERTASATIMPYAGATDTVWLLLGREPVSVMLGLCAMINSFALDFVARRRIGSRHLKQFVFKQLPFVTPGSLRSPCPWHARMGVAEWMSSRVFELVYSAWDLKLLSDDLGYDGPPFMWNEERRHGVLCELDAACCHLYGLNRDEVEYVMEAFPIVKRKDEQTHGCYRTKDTIVNIYDDMAKVIRTNAAAQAAGKPAAAQYQTRLDPPPGPPTDAAGNFIPMAQWDVAIWHRYKDVIHPPREVPVPQAVFDKGQAILEVLCLLHILRARVDTVALTMGLILMRHDTLRQRIVRDGLASPSGKAQTSRPRVRNLDGFLKEYAADGVDMLKIDGPDDMPMIALGQKAVSVQEISKRQVGADALAKAREVVVAIAKIRKTCKTNEACLDALGVENAADIAIQ
jgi:hypothetical protein